MWYIVISWCLMVAGLVLKSTMVTAVGLLAFGFASGWLVGGANAEKAKKEAAVWKAEAETLRQAMTSLREMLRRSHR